jgi:primase-polymerase (primpol)-like protein
MSSGNEPVESTRNQYLREDLGAWLSSHGLSYRKKPFAGGRIFLFDHCPFSPAHKMEHMPFSLTMEESRRNVIITPAEEGGSDGKNSGNGSKETKDGRSRTMKRTGERVSAKRHRQRRNNLGTIRKPRKLSRPRIRIQISQGIKRQHMTFSRNGNPIEYILNSFAQEHEGDFVIAQCLIMSFASRTVINSNGLHVLVTGESGKGKSHAFDTMIQHIPQDSRLDGRVSDKALFYAEDLKPGTALCLDDVSLSDSMHETLKGVTTSFKKRSSTDGQ